ncbi:hypothetical protein MNEG_13455 [Monoraphidium neglectum]|uniref:Uncharacterized protein n=1 Tax=Monoraphidium neglectum TaxID=145388 RepID=A0A0D2KF52_9CHLO|nr:hypothetical protein MNEG_13455 [Monoraphidium neglectum]KIY94508.1 hypothetical protein MNEG_13455 [Monoraphidium neglectum]|eukprot:XP_013893528.1 hypothetical protein MNEG_13455 [Monoraphidium neglectum]
MADTGPGSLRATLALVQPTDTTTISFAASVAANSTIDLAASGSLVLPVLTGAGSLTVRAPAGLPMIIRQPLVAGGNAETVLGDRLATAAANPGVAVEFVNFHFQETAFAVVDGELRFTDCIFTSQGAANGIETKSALRISGDRPKLTLNRVTIQGFRKWTPGSIATRLGAGAAINVDPTFSLASSLRPTGVVATVRAHHKAPGGQGLARHLLLRPRSPALSLTIIDWMPWLIVLT